MANLAVDLPLAIARGTNRSTGTVSYRSEPGSQAGSPLGVVVATGFLAWRPDHRLSLLLYPKRKIEVLIHMRLQAFVANIFSVCSVSPWWICFSWNSQHGDTEFTEFTRRNSIIPTDSF